QMRTEIGKLHKKLKTTFIYVTHDQTEAMTMGTRIVVMKDGIIQQVDSPTNLYQYPCNIFVAGFIGSPQMNFLNVTVDCSSNGTYLKSGGFKIKLPEGKGNRAEIKKYNGKEVIMGIRPEDIYDDQAFISSAPDCVVNVDIDLVEMMGAETYLYFQVEGTEFTARVNPRSTAKHGDNIKIAFDANKIHLFDKDTENIISH
ncbi:MAG TPA: ABC transporter ATP-binding protein, partial [Candidatus Monoglobus merdigallinarum]|nr:ABC transporter ATP-binding protein [Candidatus Monoglobus merdigallinarum]